MPGQKAAVDASIIDNEYVQELLAILNENNAPSTKDFLDVLKHVTAMERQLDTAIGELAAMRQQLAEAEANNHPIKNTLQKSVITMQSHVLDLRDRLAELKNNIIEGCKNAVSAFKEKGIAALNSIAGFFKIKPALESMENSLNKAINQDNKMINKIETVSQESREATRHIRNIGRALLGKEPIKEAKPMGKAARLMIAPIKVQKKCLEGIKKHVTAAMSSMDKLEKRAVEHKPSILGTMEKYEKQIAAQGKKDTPDVTKTTKKEERS